MSIRGKSTFLTISDDPGSPPLGMINMALAKWAALGALWFSFSGPQFRRPAHSNLISVARGSRMIEDARDQDVLVAASLIP